MHGIEGNVSENWDDTERKVRNFLCDWLEWIEADSVQIERAHRLRARRNTDSPPIIVNFKDKSAVLQMSRTKLRNIDPSTRTPYRVSEHARIHNVLSEGGPTVTTFFFFFFS